MKLKILSVDFYIEGQGITNSSFLDAPSFSDYDVVVIDPIRISEIWTSRVKSQDDGSLWSYSLFDKGFGSNLLRKLKEREKEIELLLNITGGILICIVRQNGRALNLARSSFDKDKTSTINRYSWFPNSKLYPYYFHPIDRFGETINLLDRKHPFAPFISALSSDIYYEAIIDSKIKEIAKPIATNKVEELISCEVPFGKGKIVFLPPLKDIEQQKVSGILIDCIRKSLHWTEPLKKPPWITTYSLAKEKTIKSEIDSLKEREKEIKNLIDEQEKKMFRLEMIKSLLYEQGKHGLEPAVREAFRILGFNVIEPDKYEEEYDLFIKEGDQIIIGEIEGSIKQVGVTKYRQLLDYTDVRLTEGEKVKGMLIGNGLLEAQPEKRGEQFTGEAIRGCESKRFCRMTTFELFKAVRSVIENPECRDGIKQAIINCDNEYKFDNSLSS